MEATAPAKIQIQIKSPESIKGSKTADEVYKAAFQSVFKFIESTGKLTVDNLVEVTTAANNHAQAIFMAKMGMKEGSSTNETRDALYKSLGINGDPAKSQELDKLFGASADKIQTYKAFIDSPEALLLKQFSGIENKESFLPFMHVTAAILDKMEAFDSVQLSPEAQLTKNINITEAIFEAIEKTRIETAPILGVNRNYNYSGDLAKNLMASFESRGITGLTGKEKRDLLVIIKDKFTSTEKAEESHHQLQEFLQTYGKWLAMLFPVIAAPLAKIFSYIPIIGTPANALLGCISSNAPTILAVVGTSMLNGNNNVKQAAPAADPKDKQFSVAP